MNHVFVEAQQASSGHSGPSGWISFIISLVALAASLATLWLSRLRGPKLVLLGNPPSYRTHFVHDGLRLTIPLSFRNVGAHSLVVPALKLTVPKSWTDDQEAYAHYWGERYEQFGDEKFFAPATIDGLQSKPMFAEFHVLGCKAHRISNGQHRVTLSMPRSRWWRRDSKGLWKWKEFATFEIAVTEHERRGFSGTFVHFNGLRPTSEPTPKTAGGKLDELGV